MVSDVNVVLPLSHSEYHRQILSQNCSHQMPDLIAKLQQIQCLLHGASPQTPLGELTALPRLLNWI